MTPTEEEEKEGWVQPGKLVRTRGEYRVYPYDLLTNAYISTGRPITVPDNSVAMVIKKLHERLSGGLHIVLIGNHLFLYYFGNLAPFTEYS